MTAPSFDVVGIGNALVDVLSHENDEFVDRLALNRGAMTLIEEARAQELYAAMGPGIEVSGGSAANTVAGVASFGGQAAYLGKVRDDQLGAVFAHDLRSTGVTFSCPPAADGPPTGRCLIIVTPDAQRTMNTYLGASTNLGPADVDPAVIEDAQITFLEGYLFDKAEAKEAYWKASRVAHAAGRRVSLTLSDTFCVERHRPEWLDLVREQVDVLFANHDEIQALYETDLDAAVERVRAEVEVSCITLGAEGSLVLVGDDTHEIAPEPVDVVDTTGAGDLYAAGVLFGLTNGRDHAESGRLGSVAASAVIGHTGARPGMSLAQMAR